MRVAALYDIHGNLPRSTRCWPTFEAAAPDLVVVGGNVVAGPLPGETLDRLVALGDRVRWVRGNADRIAATAERMRASGLPELDELVLRESLLEPVGAAFAARRFEALATT